MIPKSSKMQDPQEFRSDSCVLFLQFSSQNGVKSFVRAFLLMIYLIGILEDPTFWGKVDDF